MKFSFHPEAEREFNDAAEYYNRADPGLGHEFTIQVYAAIENILTYPTLWPKISGDMRRCLVKDFPYAVLYHEEQDEVFVLAVMHLHRRPEYWQDRA